MDNVELKVLSIDKSIVSMVGEDRYKFLILKRADKLVIASKNEVLVGNTAIYHTGFDENIGMIGVVHSEEKNIVDLLIKKALEELKELKVSRVIAPIDRDTWSEYRVNVSSSLKSPFYGEPSNPIWLSNVFEDNGFSANYKYISTLDILEKKDISSVDGVLIRNIDANNLESELNKIYDISVESFKNNLFYGDIDRSVFVMNYKQMYEKLHPDVLIAEYNGKEVGYLIGYDGGNCFNEGKTFVLKTIAVLEQYRGLKIAGAMVSTMGNMAYNLGYRQVIGGLIFSENVSYKLVEKYGGNSISNYALYEKVI